MLKIIIEELFNVLKSAFGFFSDIYMMLPSVCFVLIRHESMACQLYALASNQNVVHCLARDKFCVILFYDSKKKKRTPIILLRAEK